MILNPKHKSYLTQIYILTICTTSVLLSLPSTCPEHNIYIFFSNLTIATLTTTFCKHDSLRSLMFAITIGLTHTLTTFLFTIQVDELNIKCTYYEPYQLGFFAIWSFMITIVTPAAFAFLIIGFITCVIDKDFIKL